MIKSNTLMTINRETAMRIWNNTFGKCSKATDFAGREIAKAAYDDRSSNFGWNIDHILPQSKGGKTIESNLLCCHIATNDEKANKFPCFTANKKRFEIVKVQNHYEIKNSNQQALDDSINFYDSAAGIRYFKYLKGLQTKKTFVGIISVRLLGLTYSANSSALIDFITKIFSEKTIYYTWDDNEFVIRISDYCLHLKEAIADLLDRCVLLNTYLGNYFTPKHVIDDYQIFYGVHHYSDKFDSLTSQNDYANGKSALTINELVRINTDAEIKLNTHLSIGKDDRGYNVYEYNYIFTKLAENLNK